MRIRATLLLLCSTLAHATPALGEATVSEFSLGGGYSTMTVQKAPKSEFEGVKTYTLGGPSAMMGVTVYQSARAVARIFANLVIETQDSTVLRHGLSSSLGYHVFGGPLNRTEKHESATISTNYPYSVTLLLQPSVSRYAFPDTTSAQSKPLNSTVLETSVGFEVMHTFFFDTSVGLMALGSAKSFYISGDKIELQTIDMLINWRTSL